MIMLLNTIFYDWLLPNEQAFVNSFRDNDAKQRAARAFVESLPNCEWLLFLTCCIVTSIVCVLYYTWYNNIVKPFGYHYRMRHWFAWLFIALVIAFLMAMFFCIPVLKNVGLEGTDDFILRFYIGNLLYGLGIYILLSTIWCNFLPTNAYRWFKIKR